MMDGAQIIWTIAMLRIGLRLRVFTGGRKDAAEDIVIDHDASAAVYRDNYDNAMTTHLHWLEAMHGVPREDGGQELYQGAYYNALLAFGKEVVYEH